MRTRPRTARPVSRRRRGRGLLFVEPLEIRSVPSATSWPGLASPLTAAEPDSTPELARDLGLLSAAGRAEVVGALGEGNEGPADVDWFRFTLDGPATVNVATLNELGGSSLVTTLELFADAPAGPSPLGSGRRARPSSAVRHTLVAIRCSQVRSEARAGSYRSAARQARSRVSCTRSSASSSEPVIR